MGRFAHHVVQPADAPGRITRPQTAIEGLVAWRDRTVLEVGAVGDQHAARLQMAGRALHERGARGGRGDVQHVGAEDRVEALGEGGIRGGPWCRHDVQPHRRPQIGQAALRDPGGDRRQRLGIDIAGLPDPRLQRRGEPHRMLARAGGDLEGVTALAQQLAQGVENGLLVAFGSGAEGQIGHRSDFAARWPYPRHRRSLMSPLTRHCSTPPMKTIDEMLNLDLLTPEQHRQIGDWIARASSPEDILKMPAPLWQAVERASEVMGIDQDLTRPPLLGAGDSVFT